MATQTVWYDSDGWVRCVENGESLAIVHGCEKATSDPSVHGELTIHHIVTVENGQVASAEYHEPQITEAQLASRVRGERDQKLREADWTVLPDAPITDEQAWRDYRQALRDVPQQDGFPHDVTWPTTPI